MSSQFNALSAKEYYPAAAAFYKLKKRKPLCVVNTKNIYVSLVSLGKYAAIFKRENLETFASATCFQSFFFGLSNLSAVNVITDGSISFLSRLILQRFMVFLTRRRKQ